MKKIKYLLPIILLLLTLNVKADEKCQTSEYSRLKELAQKIEFDYDYILVDGVANFSIKAVNLNSDLKVIIIEDYYRDKYKEFKDNSTHIATLNGFKSGERVAVTIKAFVPNWCSGTTLLTKTVKLPYYNYFYDENECKGNEDFKYCKVLLDSNITQDTFNKEFEIYRTEKIKDNTSEKKNSIN